jgi:hypothetical protein
MLSWGGIAGIEPRLRTGRFGVRISVGERDDLFFKSVQTGSEAHTASCVMNTVVVYR